MPEDNDRHLLSDDFTRDDDCKPVSWGIASGQWDIPRVSGDASVSTVVTDGILVQSSGTVLTVPPEAQVGDVIRWTRRGDEWLVELNPDD